MATTSELQKAEWQQYFDRIARGLVGKRAEIDVESLDIGSQVEAEWLTLQGISYEPREDILSVMLEGLNHLIRRPVSVFVDVEFGQLVSLAVTDNDKVRHIIKLRSALSLPGAG
jgi:hypothetical protein